MDEQKVWVESLWLTRKENVSVEVNGEVTARESSIGMTVKGERGTKSSVLYEALDIAINKIIDQEKEHWLDNVVIQREALLTKNHIVNIDNIIIEELKKEQTQTIH